MKKDTLQSKNQNKPISQKDVASLLQKVREFQKHNQMYLINIHDSKPKVETLIISSTNTNF